MRGEVLTYDDGPGAGLISGDDGQRYTLARSDMQQLTPLRAGMKVDFVPLDGAATQVIVLAQQPRVRDAAGGVSGGSSFDWKTLFFSARGRIGRKDYWIGIAIMFVAVLLLSWIPVIGLLVTLLSIYCGICVSSQRLHDMGRSGWLAAIPYGLYGLTAVLSGMAVIGGVLGAASGSMSGMVMGFGGMALLWTLNIILNFAFLIWLGVVEGQPGDNLYGPPPTPLVNV